MTEEQILLFHTTRHLSSFMYLSGNAISSGAIQKVDGDTQVMAATKEAAFRAAGSVVAAIDAIYTNEYKCVLA